MVKCPIYTAIYRKFLKDYLSYYLVKMTVNQDSRSI